MVRAHDETGAFGQLQPFLVGQDRGEQAQAVLLSEHPAQLDRLFEETPADCGLALQNKCSNGLAAATLLPDSIPVVGIEIG